MVSLNLLLCFKLGPGQIFGQLSQRLLELISRMYTFAPSCVFRGMRAAWSVCGEGVLCYLCQKGGHFSHREGSERPVDSQVPVVSFFSHLIQTMSQPSRWSPEGMSGWLLQDNSLFSQTKSPWQWDPSITALLYVKGRWGGKCCCELGGRAWKGGPVRVEGAQAV